MNHMKKFRSQLGVTLDIIYLKTGIDISRLSRIERQIFKPKEKEKRVISRVLGKRIMQVFPEEKKRNGELL